MNNPDRKTKKREYYASLIPDQYRYILFLCAKLRKIDWKSDFVKEFSEAFYSITCSQLGLFKIHFTAPHAHCHLCKTHNIMIHYKFHPRRHNYCKSRTVGTIVKTRKLVLDSVTVPVLTSSHSYDIVMRNSSCPHNVSACVVIFRLTDSSGGFLYHCDKHSLAKSVCNFNLACIGEVSFKNVSHNFNRTRCKNMRK